MRLGPAFLAAPLIVHDPAEAHLDEQEVVVLLHDFNFRAPEEVFEELRRDAAMAMPMDEGSGRAEAAKDGENSITVRVTDSGGLTYNETFTINPAVCSIISGAPNTEAT